MPTGEAERPDGLNALLFRGSGWSPEAKVRSGFRRTLGSYHETHKGTGLEPLDSHPESGQKSRVDTRVPAMLVPRKHVIS